VAAVTTLMMLVREDSAYGTGEAIQISLPSL
jgi:hypothetical protein